MQPDDSGPDQSPLAAEPVVDSVRSLIVIDTNVLVGSAYAPQSASRQIVDSCCRGLFRMLISGPIQAEYDHILQRAVAGRGDSEPVWEAIKLARSVTPLQTPIVITEDRSDDKFLAAAVSGGAFAVVTNDRLVLNHDPHRGVRIVRPSEFLELARR